MFESITVDSLVSLGQMILVLSGAIAVIVKVVKNTINKVTEKVIEDTFSVLSKNFTKDLEIISIQLKEYVELNTVQNDIVKRCLLSNSRERINQAHEMYSEKGSIGVHTLYTLEEVYISYKELGGNSFVDSQIIELRNLPRTKE